MQMEQLRRTWGPVIAALVLLAGLLILPTGYEGALTYQNADGGFCHERGGETNLMASEQAACALASLVRAERGESSFYRMAALTQPAA